MKINKVENGWTVQLEHESCVGLNGKLYVALTKAELLQLVGQLLQGM